MRSYSARYWQQVQIWYRWSLLFTDLTKNLAGDSVIENLRGESGPRNYHLPEVTLGSVPFK
jgi:hypothetical protein